MDLAQVTIRSLSIGVRTALSGGGLTMTADLVDILVSRVRDAVVVVELRGEHDLVTKEQVWTLLSRLLRENDVVVLDVSQAEFIDSSFLHNIFRAHELAQQLGTTLRLQVGARPIVHKTLDVSGVLARLEVASGREEALRRPHRLTSDGT
jgi:anti-anti-sigma factor